MSPNTKVYLIPFSKEWYRKKIPGHTWVYTDDYILVVSDNELEYGSKTLKELTAEMGYNPFTMEKPTPESELTTYEMSINLEYLVCLADLGLLGGDF